MNEHPDAAIIRSGYEAMRKEIWPRWRRFSTTASPGTSRRPGSRATTTLTRKSRIFTGLYADVYHLRDGKATEHWHLAVGPKADEEFLTF